jgi:outer membrane protein OmpA-like peptidoglycan-associated protein
MATGNHDSASHAGTYNHRCYIQGIFYKEDHAVLDIAVSSDLSTNFKKNGGIVNHFKIVYLSVFVVMLAVSVYAQAIKEHPLIRPFPGSVLAENMSKHKNFDVYEFYCFDEATKKREKKAIKGEYWRLLYEVRKPSGDRVRTISKLEFFENYKVAAEEKGGRMVFEDIGQMVLTIPRDDGGVTWLRVSGSANLGQQDLIIVDENPFKKSLTFGPAEMKAALDADGRIQLYGILFDLDKATLQPESTNQLQHVVTLLKDNPDLMLEVQGHTDDQGSDDYNLKLSQRRAETVVAYLGLFDIDTNRLVPKGYGEFKPVMPNTTEEERAKNRRVELVKR